MRLSRLTTSPSVLYSLALSALLLSGCATQGRHVEPSAEPPATTVGATPAYDWAPLQQALSGALAEIPGAEVTTTAGNGLHLRIPVSDGFASGSAALKPTLVQVLDSLVAPLNDHPKVLIHIVGHTDSVGSEMYNLQLSIKRGEAVMEHLRSRGIVLARLSADGKGEAEPIADNGREAGRARNRRVEIVLTLDR
ncbi:OmpA family protein [Parazoarcus communis]|uniref:OmpA family protein n=1 Tax=Parazoarcus communis SWub3 = DSM 12120 TaxID=1121029 RepID=A0A323UQQ3_9RHOO|nr:OmpA family protein [Parazoarcus communis]NMG72229.1 OmpA family protein [Parazoarcus communis SWub3 = DSM 12120]PZA14814.1 OmpA family protein [Azoarcus communis] [Parazoarcus communis SWub3 = DSM 12120]